MRNILLLSFLLFALPMMSQNSTSCSSKKYIDPQKSVLELDNGYRADSCSYRCLCEPQYTDGEKHYYFYDQYGRDTSDWTFYLDTIIHPWYLSSKDSKEYYVLNELLREKWFWWDSTSGTWNFSGSWELSYNALQQLIHEEKTSVWAPINPRESIDYSYDVSGLLQQSLMEYLDESDTTMHQSKILYTYLPSGYQQFNDSYSYIDSASQWLKTHSNHFVYDSVWQCIIELYGSWSNYILTFDAKTYYEYDQAGRLISDYTLQRNSVSALYDTTKVHQYYYTPSGKLDSVLTALCWSNNPEWEMLEKYYYDSLGNQIRWEYYLHYQQDSVWNLFGWEDCYYSKHFLVNGIDKGNIEYTLNVYPNPANGEVSVELDGEPLAEVRICDIRGRELLFQQTENEPKVTIDVSALHQGLYFLTCKDASGKVFAKSIIIQH